MSRFKILISLICCFFMNQVVYSQLGTLIPANRRVNWDTAGYHRNPNSTFPSTYDTTINVTRTGDPNQNWQNIQNAINKAVTPGKRKLIQLGDGKYTIDHTIEFDWADSNITIRGTTSPGGKTTIVCNSTHIDNLIIQLHGYIEGWFTRVIDNYDPNNRQITFLLPQSDIQVNNYLDIRVPNPPENTAWYDRVGQYAGVDDREIDFLGQIVKVKSKLSNTTYELEDDISILWNLWNWYNNNNNPDLPHPYAHRFQTPVKEVGIEHLEIKPVNGLPVNTAGIQFVAAVNCWVNSVELDSCYTFNIGINKSHAITVRNCYIHDSRLYGGGQGYGVTIVARSTYCLVENNIFKRMRHSMQVSSSANRNVFGYNYSLQQHDTGGTTGDDTLGDLSFHGHFPYANLFEGNRVDRIWADNYFGSNGPYNTFCRNLAYYNILKLQWTDSTNVIGNEAKLIRYSQLYPDKTLDKYGNKLYHAHWDPTYEKIDYCTDKSYYYSSRPGFIVSSSFTWPPMGPPISAGGDTITQNIPARKRYFEEITHESYSNDWSNEFLASDIAVYRPDGDSNPNLKKRIVGFSSSGLPSASFSYQTEIAYPPQGGYDFKGITSGDFNGDEIDDIAVYRSYGDSNPNRINRVWVFKSDGT